MRPLKFRILKQAPENVNHLIVRSKPSQAKAQSAAAERQPRAKLYSRLASAYMTVSIQMRPAKNFLRAITTYLTDSYK